MIRLKEVDIGLEGDPLRSYEQVRITMVIDSNEGKPWIDSCTYLQSLTPTPEGMQRTRGSMKINKEGTICVWESRDEEIPLAL